MCTLFLEFVDGPRRGAPHCGSLPYNFSVKHACLAGNHGPIFDSGVIAHADLSGNHHVIANL